MKKYLHFDSVDGICDHKPNEDRFGRLCSFCGQCRRDDVSDLELKEEKADVC
jgi:hypothetical protein